MVILLARGLSPHTDSSFVACTRQTELGWPGVGNAVGLGRMPIKYGACAAPVPGFELAIADDDGHILAQNTLGDMFLKLPLPPGTLTTLYNDNERFVESYLTKMPGYYDTGDAVYIGMAAACCIQNRMI